MLVLLLDIKDALMLLIRIHLETEEWPSFVPAAMPIMRALTPQSAQIISFNRD